MVGRHIGWYTLPGYGREAYTRLYPTLRYMEAYTRLYPHPEVHGRHTRPIYQGVLYPPWCPGSLSVYSLLFGRMWATLRVFSGNIRECKTHLRNCSGSGGERRRANSETGSGKRLTGPPDSHITDIIDGRQPIRRTSL